MEPRLVRLDGLDGLGAESQEMSCETNLNKLARVAHVAAGIPRLASKRGFYAISLAAGVAGLVGLLARKQIERRVWATWRWITSPPAPGRSGSGDGKTIPALSSPETVSPTSPHKLPGKGCVGCGASPKTKFGPWYVIQGKAYCQDCAPTQAGEAGVNLALHPSHPPPSPAAASAGLLSGLSPSKVGRRVEIRLVTRPVTIAIADGETGEVGEHTFRQNAYVVLTEDGRDTGLAITPEFLGKPGRWNVTHTPSGHVFAGPYGSRGEAKDVASRLAIMDWTRPTSDYSEEELEIAKEIIRGTTRPSRSRGRVTPRAGQPVDTILERRPVTVTLSGANGGDVSLDLPDSFAILTRDGRETGLAVTPDLRQVQTPGGLQYETADGWNVTHLVSGRRLAGPYDFRLDAQGVASRVASMNWHRPLESYSDEEKEVVRRLIREYEAELVDVRNRVR